MARRDGMTITLRGADSLLRQLDAVTKNVAPMVRGALNTTASKARNQLYISPLRASIKAGKLRRALKLKRANTRHMNARIIPSGSGIPVPEYRGWGFDRIDATRGRIWVTGPHGRKIAAGFVNPASVGRQPLATRSEVTRQLKGRAKATTYSYRRSLGTALGPSLAYWFKQLTTQGDIDWIGDELAKEFERRLDQTLRTR